jgi:hypothetical protein
MRFLTKEETDEIDNEYGDFILINTNFSVNNVCRYSNEKCGFSDSIREQMPQQSYILSSMLSLVYKITNAGISQDIVLRPHPAENKTIYEKLLSFYDGVHVVRQGEIRPWISAADAVIHNSCTTGLESAIMKKPVISYLSGEYDRHFSNEVSIKAETPERVIKILKDKSGEIISPDKKTIKKQVENIDTKAAFNIKSTIDSKLNPDAEFNKNQSSIPKFISKIVYKLDKNMYRTIRNSYKTPERWTYTSYKFDITSSERIKTLCGKFSEKLGKTILSESSPYTDNLFKIYSN